mmetsp:Transcript_47184/g.135197  ORF Transcript_47184/g.135197 Transcript_47184/m.135197 type:complete len:222 (-) Transcript_47184:1684-2349(-)
MPSRVPSALAATTPSTPTRGAEQRMPGPSFPQPQTQAADVVAVATPVPLDLRPRRQPAVGAFLAIVDFLRRRRRGCRGCLRRRRRRGRCTLGPPRQGQGRRQFDRTTCAFVLAAPVASVLRPTLEVLDRREFAAVALRGAALRVRHGGRRDGWCRRWSRGRGAAGLRERALGADRASADDVAEGHGASTGAGAELVGCRLADVRCARGDQGTEVAHLVTTF